MVSSTTPRPAPIWPPVTEHVSMRNARTSSARVRSSSRESARTSAGELTRERTVIVTGNVWGSRFPRHDEASEVLQLRRGDPRVAQGTARLVREGGRALPRPREAEQRRVGALLEGG